MLLLDNNLKIPISEMVQYMYLQEIKNLKKKQYIQLI